MRRHYYPIAIASLLIPVGGCLTVQSNPSSLPDAMKIPEIQHAVDVRQSLEDEKRQTTSLGAELRAASTSIATRPVALSSLSSRDIIQREIEITQSLRQSAKVILEKGPLFVEKIDRLSGRLQSAPECYLVAARLFRKFADEESSQLLT